MINSYLYEYIFLVPFARHVIAHSSSGAVDIHSAITWCAILLLISLFMNYNSSDWICFQYWEYSCPSQCQESKAWKRFTWLKLMIILQKQCNICKLHLFSFVVVLLMQTNFAIFSCNHFNYNKFSYTYELILCVFSYAYPYRNLNYVWVKPVLWNTYISTFFSTLLYVACKGHCFLCQGWPKVLCSNWNSRSGPCIY